MSNRAQHQGNSRHSVIVPYRIGLLLDRDDDAHRDLVDAIRLGIEESRVSGELDRDVVLVVREVAGAPDRSVLDVTAAWRDMYDNDTLLCMVGPFGDDNGAAVRDLIEAGGMPTLTTSAADDYCGDYCFQLTIDHPVDNAHLLLRYARSRGCAYPLLVHEPGPHGRSIERAFRQAARQDRFASIETIARDDMLADGMARARALGCSAVIYVGGGDHMQIDSALDALDWRPLRMTGTEIGRAHPVHGKVASLEGWIGLDATHGDNKQFRRFARAFEERYDRKADHLRAAQGYDIGRMVGMVCANIRPPSPEGMRNGLDRMRMLLTATGAPGTVACFTRYDHRGLKNHPHVMVEVKDGKLVPVVAPVESAA